MRRLSHLLSLILLTVWLPATQHCNLEAAGIIATQCTDGCKSDAQSSDGCGIVEAGLYKISGDAVKAIAPNLLASNLFLWVRFIGLVDRPESTRAPSEPFRRPLDWVTAWNFVRRAAPPCRAPSVDCA